MWHSFLMLFVVRSFGPGDYIVPDGQKDLTVDRIELLTTVGYGKNGRQVRINNWFLWERALQNLGRSAEFVFTAFWRIDAKHTEAELRALEAGMRAFVASRETVYRPRSVAFFLTTSRERPSWDELDLQTAHTVGFSCKLANATAADSTRVNEGQTALLLEWKRLCAALGIRSGEPEHISLRDLRRREQEMLLQEDD